MGHARQSEAVVLPQGVKALPDQDASPAARAGGDPERKGLHADRHGAPERDGLLAAGHAQPARHQQGGRAQGRLHRARRRRQARRHLPRHRCAFVLQPLLCIFFFVSLLPLPPAASARPCSCNPDPPRAGAAAALPVLICCRCAMVCGCHPDGVQQLVHISRWDLCRKPGWHPFSCELRGCLSRLGAEPGGGGRKGD